ncbi:MAG: FMN-binding protein [Planctomycetes bacterium]|nr:FMN-binding protein [Planctomycetota bacterium]
MGQVSALQLVQPREALELTFPKATFERISVSLDEDQVNEIQRVGKLKLSTPRVRQYRAIVGGHWIGTAYFDTRKVRTKSQTLMIAIDGRSRIKRIEILRFDEPREYRASASWISQMKGKPLSGALRIKGGVRNLTGATLTAHATVNAVRQALAIHQVLLDTERKKGDTEEMPAKKTVGPLP